MCACGPHVTCRVTCLASRVTKQHQLKIFLPLPLLLLLLVQIIVTMRPVFSQRLREELFELWDHYDCDEKVA